MLGHRTGPEQSQEPWRSLSSLKLFPQILSQGYGYIEVTTALSVVVSLRCKQKSPHWRLMSCSSGAYGIHHQGEGTVFSGGVLPLFRDSTLRVGASAVEERYVPVWQKVQAAKEWAPSSSLCVKTSSLPHAG